MSKCIICGKELLSGDGLWEQGVCDSCYDEKTVKQYPFKQGIKEKDQQIAELKKQLEVTEQLRQEALSEGIKVVERDSNIIRDLQKQLHAQPKEIVEKIKDYCKKFITDGTASPHLPQIFRGRRDINYLVLETYLQEILKEYGGEE